MSWEVYITYCPTPYTLRADLEYYSNQIMLIRVRDKTSTLLLENDYPALRLLKSKKGINWKIREGSMIEGVPDTSQLFLNIVKELEMIITSMIPPEQ